MINIIDDLYNLSDIKYKKFQENLIPTIDKSLILGVRIPILRKYAKEISNSFEAKVFLESLPHTYYDENMLHMLLLSSYKDIEVLEKLDVFLEYVDNWAVCDVATPKVFSKHLSEVNEYIDKWIISNKTYKVRYAIKTIMTLYLDGSNSNYYITKVANIKSSEYYINMMIAWFMQVAIVKNYDFAVTIFENKTLDRWTHNKAISKCTDSYQISDDKKDYLKSLRY